MTTDWPMVPLGELLKPAGEQHRVESGRFYPNIGIYGFGRGCFEKPPIDGNLTSASTLYQVRAGQLIYSRLFAFEGAYAVVPNDFDGAFVSNEFPCFDVQRDRVLPGYLRWIFSRPCVWSALAAMSKGMGDRRKRIHPEQILAFRVALPALAAQERIVEKLDSVESSIAHRRRRAEVVASELAALLKSAFRSIATDAPRIRMAEIAPLVRRAVTIDPETSYTEIGVRSFYKGTFHRRTVNGAEFSWQKLYRISEGDLIFSNLMAWEKGIAVARARDNGCVGNHRMLTCRADRDRAVPEYLWFYFTTDEGFMQILSASPGSIARNKTLSADQLRNIPVPIPPVSDQQWFRDLLLKERAARAAQISAADGLNRLLPSLLEQLFGTGRG